MAINISAILSVVSLLVSIIVAWRTLFRRGRLCMTQPVQIAFTYEKEKPKIFLRTLLYTTGKRGYVIEGLYLKISQNDVVHTFGFWGYGERNELMVAGGLRINEDGIAFNHHFLQTDERSQFDFADGKYEISIYARIVNRRNPRLLSKVNLSLPATEASALRFKRIDGVLFTWEPDLSRYSCSPGPTKPVPRATLL